jgi:subtilisin family serine protease
MLTTRNIVAASAVALSLGSGLARGDEPPPFVPDEVVVRLAPGTSAAAFAQQYGSAVLESITSRNIHRLDVPPGLTEPEFVDLIDDDARVTLVELNWLGGDRNPDGGTQSIFVVERYEDFMAQLAMGVVRADQAQTRARGSGILVAVIDSGLDTEHPLFAGRVPFGGLDLIENDTTPQDAPDGVDNDADGLFDEMTGHGTLVAGVILRVVPDAWILPIRVLDSDGGSTNFRLIDGVYAAVDRGADILNISLGTVAPSPLLESAIAEAGAGPRLVVCAAGNDGTDQTPWFPAAFSGTSVLSVAATRNNDVLATFSNWGGTISLTAPGDPVIGAVPGGAYGSARGTSFAAPIVAGSAALLRSLTPCVPMDTVAARVLATADNIDAQNPNFAGKIGAGRLDAAAAVGVGTTPPPGIADLNNDDRVDVEDLYRLNASPRDLNGDGVANAADRAALEAFLRRFEELDRAAGGGR